MVTFEILHPLYAVFGCDVPAELFVFGEFCKATLMTALCMRGKTILRKRGHLFREWKTHMERLFPIMYFLVSA